MPASAPRSTSSRRALPGSPPAQPAPETAPGRVAVGFINTTWGLRGHVKVSAYSNNPDRFAIGAVLYVRGEPRTIVDLNTSQGYPIVKFEGYPDATAAQVLRGTLIEIDEADLPPLPDGEYYLHDLLGLAVVSTSGEQLGTLANVLTTGANDVYVLRREGKPDALIPAIPDVIRAVDLEARTMTIEAMPGLIV